MAVERDVGVLTTRMRGMLVGLALGEAIEHESEPVIPSMTGAQLACFTAEGLIRASVRMRTKGISHTPTVLWHALCRWGYLRGHHQDVLRRRWELGSDQVWPNGFLSQAPQVCRDAGSSPTTVQALADGEQGTPDRPKNNRDSYQALLRVLPAAAWAPTGGSGDNAEFHTFVTESLALTHGGEAAIYPTRAALSALSSLIYAEGETNVFDLRRVQAMMQRHSDRDSQSTSMFNEADLPLADEATLKRLAGDPSSRSVVVAGLYAAASYPRPEQTMDALRFCRFDASQSKAVAAFTGALLGAAFGPDAFDLGARARLELSWVLETLAADLVAEMQVPVVASHESQQFDAWFAKYPGW